MGHVLTNNAGNSHSPDKADGWPWEHQGARTTTRGKAMLTIIAIDPGPEKSGWIVLEDGTPKRWGKDDNLKILRQLQDFYKYPPEGFCIVAMEKIASMGMAVGEETFETVFWTGRFFQAYEYGIVERITRMEVKMHLCNNSKAKDANIRKALIDRFGGQAAIKKGGPLYKISGDVWAALGVAITIQDKENREKEKA